MFSYCSQIMLTYWSSRNLIQLLKIYSFVTFKVTFSYPHICTIIVLVFPLFCVVFICDLSLILPKESRWSCIQLDKCVPRFITFSFSVYAHIFSNVLVSDILSCYICFNAVVQYSQYLYFCRICQEQGSNVSCTTGPYFLIFFGPGDMQNDIVKFVGLADLKY